MLNKGQSTPFIKNVFALKQCGNIMGTDVHCFEDEADMLRAWSDFIRQVDPDVIIGYNISNFDFPYLLDRAHALKVSEFPFLGRVSNSLTKAKDTLFSSKAYGTRESKTLCKLFSH